MGLIGDVVGKAKRLGTKALDTADAGLRIGTKALGSVSRMGHKVLDKVNHAVGFVENIPFVGGVAAPVLAPVKSVLNVANAGLGVVDTAKGIGDNLSAGVRATQSAVASGDYHQAANVLRDTAKDTYSSGKVLRSSAQNVLERARRQ